MRLFRVDKENRSFKYPAVKIAVCVALIALMIARPAVRNESINGLIGLAAGIIVVMCILCIYISLAEIAELFWKKRDDKKLLSRKPVMYSIDEIVRLMEANDIIEFKIISDDSVITFGSSSDCEAGSPDFFDKKYYIGAKINDDITAVKDRLIKFSHDGENLKVVAIDDVNPAKRF